MSLTQSPSAPSAARLSADLRKIVLRRLAERGLQTGEALAPLLGVAPSAAQALLRRSTWSIDQSLWVIDRAGLGVQVDISEFQ